MSLIINHYNRPSYTIANEKLKVYITVEGGHLTADFFLGGKVINPFFIAPWWREAPYLNEDRILNILRGDFFCMPFGGNEDEYNGINYPVHGETCNNSWELENWDKQEDTQKICLAMDLSLQHGRVKKQIEIRENEPIIYSTHSFEGLSFKTPVGHHPTLIFPEEVGSGIIDFSPIKKAFTTPVPTENPENRGYSRLNPGIEITDLKKIPAIDGSTMDITKYPTPFGYEDIVLLINDDSRRFSYSAVTIPSKGYLYFQLKNPRVLSKTLLWMSNGGRHYPPWNGRVRAVMGIEEITAYYHYGIRQSIEKNHLQELGVNTYLDINEDTKIKLIIGLIPIKEDFKGVKDIQEKDENTITIMGKNGEVIDVPCDITFLK